VGRFLTPDPIGFAGGFNLYAYCGNNPVGAVDPSGLWGVQFGDGPNICIWNPSIHFTRESIVDGFPRSTGFMRPSGTHNTGPSPGVRHFIRTGYAGGCWAGNSAVATMTCWSHSQGAALARRTR
jgi:hypothetical protein